MDSDRINMGLSQAEAAKSGYASFIPLFPAAVTLGAKGQEDGVNRMEGPDLSVTGSAHANLYFIWEWIRLAVLRYWDFHKVIQA